MKLQIPDEPYPDWSRFVAAVWKHGMDNTVYEPSLAKYHCWRAGEAASGALTRANEARRVRPSAFVACARQTFFMQEGHEPQPMPPNIGLTFAVGHFLHEVSFGALQSALPEGFEIDFEVAVPLPSWWPDTGEAWVNRKGHIDCIIEVKDSAKAGKYLPINGDRKALIDLKSMGGYSFREHKKKDYASVPDSFGYLTQLAIYADVIRPDVVLLAGISRDQLTADMSARRIHPDKLGNELRRVKAALVQKGDPGPELQDRWGKKVDFFCGGGGRPGYCPFRERCHATHPGA